MFCKNSKSAKYCSAVLIDTRDYTLNFSSNLGISPQELCPHSAREDTVLFNLLILFCWNLTKTHCQLGWSPLLLCHTSAPFHGRPKGICWTWNVLLRLSLLCHELNREQVCLGRGPVLSSCPAKDRQTHTICCSFLLLALFAFLYFCAFPLPLFLYLLLIYYSSIRDVDHGVCNAVLNFLFKWETWQQNVLIKIITARNFNYQIIP